MTEYIYYQHKWCKDLLRGLEWYVGEEFQTKDRETPQALLDYKTYLKERILENPPSIFDLPESEYHQPDDGRYPSEQFLISLSETWIPYTTRETYDDLMSIISYTWYCLSWDDVIDDNGVYKLYDGGWSGNEDIVDAILSNPSIKLLCEIDTSTCIIKIKYRFAEEGV